MRQITLVHNGINPGCMYRRMFRYVAYVLAACVVSVSAVIVRRCYQHEDGQEAIEVNCTGSCQKVVTVYRFEGL